MLKALRGSPVKKSVSPRYGEVSLDSRSSVMGLSAYVL